MDQSENSSRMRLSRAAQAPLKACGLWSPTYRNLYLLFLSDSRPQKSSLSSPTTKESLSLSLPLLPFLLHLLLQSRISQSTRESLWTVTKAKPSQWLTPSWTTQSQLISSLINRHLSTSRAPGRPLSARPASSWKPMTQTQIESSTVATGTPTKHHSMLEKPTQGPSNGSSLCHSLTLSMR